MKKTFFILFSALLLSGCSNKPSESSSDTSNTIQSSSQATVSFTTRSKKNTSDSTFSTKASSQINASSSSSSISTSKSQAQVNTVERSSADNSKNQRLSSNTEKKNETYYKKIKDAWQKEKDYVDSLADPSVKQSVQTPFSAANNMAWELEMNHPSDSELIQRALKKVLNGQDAVQKNSKSKNDASVTKGNHIKTETTTKKSSTAHTNNTNNTTSSTAAVSQSEQAGSNTWSSMDEAIQFFEATFKNTNNELSQSIVWSNYDQSYWHLVKNSGAKITLHFNNAGGAGGDYYEFIKDGDYTNIIEYLGNASYPNNPTAAYTIANNGHKEL